MISEISSGNATGRIPGARIIVLALGLLGGCWSPAALQGAEATNQVPLLDGGDMILVPVQAFNKTLYFIADTGFTVTAVDEQYDSELGPQIDALDAVSPLGTRNDVPVYNCPDISIAGQPLRLTRVIKLDLTMLRRITGKQCDGILGLDWFAKNVVAINFDNLTLTFAPEAPAAVKDGFVPVAIGETNGYYTMKVVVNGDRNFNLMIDTGDSSSLSLNQNAWQQLFPTNQTKTSVVTVADAVNHVAQTKIGVVRQMTVQNLDYTNLHATYIRHLEHPSRIGIGFFRRHNVTFDFAGDRLYLQPDHHFAAADVEDMSGLHLLRFGEKTVVYSVDDHSPAAAEGITAQDVLVAVNDQPAGGLSMHSIRQILRAGEGKPVALQIQRGTNALGVKIVLRKAI